MPRRRARMRRPSASTSTCGGRGRPLYVEPSAVPYAPGIGDRDEVAAAERREPMLAERIGRLADRTVHPRRSVVRGDPAEIRDRSAVRGEREDRVARAIQRRPDEFGHPGVEDRHGLTAPIANVKDSPDEPAGAGHEEAARFHREPGRPASRRAAHRGASGSPGRRARAVARPVSHQGRAIRPGPPGTRRRRRACRSRAGRRAAEPEARAPAGPRHATRRRRRAAIRRGDGSRASEAVRPGRRPPRSPRRARPPTSRTCSSPLQRRAQRAFPASRRD